MTIEATSRDALATSRDAPATSRDAPATSRGAPETPGVLLAGGLARRMGGGDKPMRTVAGRTILARVIARLTPQCDGLILNANGDSARFAAFGLPVIPDGVADFPGPLAGILAGLDWAAANRLSFFAPRRSALREAV